MYVRTNNLVFFLLPALAVDIDTDDRYFIEIAWFNIAIGFGAWE